VIGLRRLRISRGPAVLALMFALAAAIRLPTLSFPLVEAHAFRQTQTAYAALVYHETRIDLLHTPLPTIGPPWELPFELPVFQAVAATAMNAGLAPEVALRVSDLGFFLLGGVGLLALLRAFDFKARTSVVLVAYLFSPFSLEWSRASISEYLALSAALGAVASLRRFDRSNGWAWLMASIVLTVAAFLLKITTAAVWLLPALFVARRRVPAASVAAIGLFAGMIWTRYGDSIKETGPLTRQFTSLNLVEWTLGTVGDRLSPTVWGALILNLTPLGLLALVGLILVRQNPRVEGSQLFILSGAVIVAALLMFPTLYAKHSYYAVAISPAIAILIGLSVDAALSARSVRYVRFVGGVLLAATFIVSAPLWTRALGPSDPDHELVSADQIRSATNRQDRIIIVGRDYSPAILFYADRAGIAVPSAARLSDLPSEILSSYVVFDCGIDNLGTCRPVSLPDPP
jgi:hypothetical protein